MKLVIATIIATTLLATASPSFSRRFSPGHGRAGAEPCRDLGAYQVF